MGVCNILCLTGDGVQAGDHPQAKPVFDLDCISLLETVRTHARRAAFLSRPQDHRRRRRCSSAPPRIRSRRPTTGGRCGSPRRSRPAPSSSRPSTASTCRCCERFMARVARPGPARARCFILVGVGPLRSAKAARLDARATCRASTFPTRVDRAARAGAAKASAREGKQPLRRADPGDPRDRGRARACT